MTLLDVISPELKSAGWLSQDVVQLGRDSSDLVVTLVTGETILIPDYFDEPETAPIVAGEQADIGWSGDVESNDGAPVDGISGQTDIQSLAKPGNSSLPVTAFANTTAPSWVDSSESGAVSGSGGWLGGLAAVGGGGVAMGASSGSESSPANLDSTSDNVSQQRDNSSEVGLGNDVAGDVAGKEASRFDAKIMLGPAIDTNDLRIRVFDKNGDVLDDVPMGAGGIARFDIADQRRDSVTLRVYDTDDSQPDYMDEATGKRIDLPVALHGTFNLSADVDDSPLYITPLTELVWRLAQGNIDKPVPGETAFQAAEKAVARFFLNQDFLDIPQAVVTTDGTPNLEDGNVYGQVLAVISVVEQLAREESGNESLNVGDVLDQLVSSLNYDGDTVRWQDTEAAGKVSGLMERAVEYAGTTIEGRSPLVDTETLRWVNGPVSDVSALTMDAGSKMSASLNNTTVSDRLFQEANEDTQPLVLSEHPSKVLSPSLFFDYVSQNGRELSLIDNDVAAKQWPPLTNPLFSERNVDAPAPLLNEEPPQVLPESLFFNEVSQPSRELPMEENDVTSSANTPMPNRQFQESSDETPAPIFSVEPPEVLAPSISFDSVDDNTSETFSLDAWRALGDFQTTEGVTENDLNDLNDLDDLFAHEQLDNAALPMTGDDSITPFFSDPGLSEPGLSQPGGRLLADTSFWHPLGQSEENAMSVI